MLMYGVPAMAAAVTQAGTNVVVYNISSYNENYERVNLIPPNSLGYNTEFEFDMNYANWIFYNNFAFIEFMKIISTLNNGYNVFLTISNEEWGINLIESLTKLIQERYGIVAVMINDIEDFFYAKDSDTSEGMGLFNMQQDLSRYSEVAYNQLKGGEENEFY